MLNLNDYLIFVYIKITFKCIFFYNRFSMASAGGSPMSGRDPTWKYCSPIEGNRKTICNFCGLLMKNGGITRFKFHLMHNGPHNNTKKCLRVSPEVKEEI